MLIKDVEFYFNEECLESFKTLKNPLVFTPIIHPPDWSISFEIMCDASNYAVGVVLEHKKDKKLHFIYYASGILDEAQINDNHKERTFGRGLCY